jgi:hypothetical protein
MYAAAFMGYARPAAACVHIFSTSAGLPRTRCPRACSACACRAARSAPPSNEDATAIHLFTRYRFIETTSAHRETRLSIMARVNLSTRNRSRLALVGGPAFSLGETKNVSFRREGVVPYSGATAYEWREVAFGFTYGLETGLSLGDRANLVLPARITVLKRDRDSEPGNVDAYAGVGVTLKLFRTTFLK